MKTLIELYDESPFENVIGTEVFRPEETIFICPPEVAANESLKASLIKYFKHRGCKVKLTFTPVSLLDASKVTQRLKQVLSTHDDCAIDIAGGTDAALFAAGAASGEFPVYTYSRKKNTFYEIRNAPFARNLPCTVRLDVRSCFLMAGGNLLPGREDNEILRQKLTQIDRLYSVFSEYRTVWNRQIGYIQKISSSEEGEMKAEGSLTEKCDHGSVTANKGLFAALEKAGLILDLAITSARISFRFPDKTVRFWLRDIGAVLEHHVYRACLEAGCFDDVVLSAVVNWQNGTNQRDGVTNEIDVMAVHGIRPVFISCKTSEIRTEALNELSILRDRFGGKYARAIVVTSKSISDNYTPMHNRAAQLGIEVLEWEDLQMDNLVSVLRKTKQTVR